MPADQNLRSMINVAAMSVVTVTVLIASWQQISPAAQRAVVERTYPEGIAAHLSRDMNASVRLFNAYDWGGFLIQRDILPYSSTDVRSSTAILSSRDTLIDHSSAAGVEQRHR